MNFPNVSPSEEYENHIVFRHKCSYEGIGPDGAVTAILPIGGNGWSYDAQSDTVTPLILCRECGLHGWWTNGVWCPC